MQLVIARIRTSILSWQSYGSFMGVEIKTMQNGKHEYSDAYYRLGMSDDEFRSAAKDMANFVVRYTRSLKGRQAYPSLEPGYMKELLPSNAPQKPEKWTDVFDDLDKIVVAGLTHWQSSRFFAYFPTASSYPAILADILIGCCSCVGFSWVSSPSCTELEPIVLDWLARAIGLPDSFIYDGKGPGCGVIQGSASEATLMTLLSARTKALNRLSSEHPEASKHEVLSKLVVYASENSHTSVERACLIAMVDLHKVPVDENVSVRGKALQEAMDKDRAAGKIPFYVCATLGTTDCTSFDNLEEIADVCSSDIWIHVDAAYAGCSFICPEFRHLMKGVEKMTSFSFNPHKWLMVNFDFAALWVRNSLDLINSFNLNPVIMQHGNQDRTIDYRHWQIPLGRRFRSLKLWFVLRIYGIENLKKRIREDVADAKIFEKLVRSDGRFEVLFPVILGLTCFRLVKHNNDREKYNKMNKELLRRIVDSRDIFIVGSEVGGVFYLRLCSGSNACDEEAIRFAWKSIQKHATGVLEEY